MKFKREIVDIVANLRAEGWNYKRIAEEIGASESTLRLWRKKYPEFRDACKITNPRAKDNVQQALLKIAQGYDFQEVTRQGLWKHKMTGAVCKFPPLDSNPADWVHFMKVTKTVTKHRPPETQAIMHFLSNLYPSEWKIKQLVQQQKVGDEYEDWTEEQLESEIERLEQNKRLLEKKDEKE